MFFAFQRLALQGFGGVLPVAQRELVDRQRWLDKEQFLALLAMGQVLPGPNIVNVALMIGDRFFGWRGVLASVAGLMLAPLAVMLALTVLYGEFAANPVVSGALRGMGAVAAGLVISTAFKLIGGLARNPLGWASCLAYAVACAVMIGGLRWRMTPVVLGLGALAMAQASWALRRALRAAFPPKAGR
jgi:chromate transporter